MENGMQMTLEECMPETFQKPTVGASDSLASFEELIFLQKKDIYQLKTYLSEIECLLTKEDGKQLPQLCRETTQESGTSTDLASCQLAQRQNTRIMSLAYPNQLNSNQSRNSMIAITPQWCCLMKSQTNTVKRSGGLSDAILLMGGEFADKIDREGEGLCLRSVIKKREEFEHRLSEANLHGTYTEERTCGKYHVCNNQLYEYLGIFGEYAYGKRIPREALCLPREKAEYFYNGYMSGDGRNDKEEATSTSAAVILGMCIIAQRLGKPVPAVYYTKRDSKCTIEGRECKQRDTYTFRISNKSVKGYYRGRYVCRKLYQPTESDQYETVYNLSVEEDESYIANGAIVHNCQDISVAGKQLGFQGNRSSLFFRVMYLIGQLKEEDKPTYLFIENVKNLLSVNGGWDFARLLIEMEQGGYDAEWQVLNSKDFGVPQNRERCFIIGHLRGRSAAEIFPIKGTNRENSVSIIGHRDGFRRNTQVFDQEGITEALDTGQGGGRGHHVALPCFVDLSYQGIELTEKARCLQARYNKGVSNHKAETSGVAIPVLTPDRAEKRQNGRRFKENGEPMFTLTSQDRHGVATGISPIGGVYTGVSPEFYRGVYEGCFRCLKASTHDSGVALKLQNIPVSREYVLTRPSMFMKISDELTIYAVWYEKYQCYIAIRKLTPKECFRLQGWTDEYFEKAAFVNSDSQLYKQAGNGVTVNVIEAIAKQLKFA